MEEISFTGKKILIVEDDFSSRLYLNKLLEKSGAEILNATNGREAYEMIVKMPEIDIVLMDIQLPVLDGYMCTSMLREAGVRVPIIAQTAYGLTGDREKILEYGFNDFLIKPIFRGQLFEKLSVYLR